MNKEPSHELIFEINYCAHLERMTGTFNRRIDKFVCFLQILLGATILSQSSMGWLCGFLVACLSAYQLAYKPGEIAGNAKVQALRYQQLADSIKTIDTNEVKLQQIKIEEQDTPTISSLFNPARKKTSIYLYGYDIEDDHKLTTKEKFAAFLGGGIPS